VLCTTFIKLQFGFVIFCCKNIGAKAACKNADEIDYSLTSSKHFSGNFLSSAVYGKIYQLYGSACFYKTSFT